MSVFQDELKIMEEAKAKQEEMEEARKIEEAEAIKAESTIKIENEEREEKIADDSVNGETENETFKDILDIPGNLLDTFMNEGESSVKTNTSLIDGKFHIFYE